MTALPYILGLLVFVSNKITSTDTCLAAFWLCLMLSYFITSVPAVLGPTYYTLNKLFHMFSQALWIAIKYSEETYEQAHF